MMKDVGICRIVVPTFAVFAVRPRSSGEYHADQNDYQNNS